MKLNTLKLSSRILNSPTLMTWASFGSKSLIIVLITPLILKKYDTHDVNFWYFVSLWLTFLTLFDGGFGATFVRMIAYRLNIFNNIGNVLDISYQLNIYQLMTSVYKILCLIAFIILSTVGSFLIKDTVNHTHNPILSWITWWVFCLSFVLQLWGNVYLNLLQGANRVALVRRWDAIFNITNTIIISLVLLFIKCDIGYIILLNQFWLIVAVLRNYFLTNNIVFSLKSKVIGIENVNYDGVDKHQVLSSAIKSGVGILFSQGIIQASAFILQQVVDPRILSSYLISLNLLQNIRTFTQAPFYSRIPIYSMLYKDSNIIKLREETQKSTRLVYLLFTFSIVFFYFFSNDIFLFLGTKSKFISLDTWLLLGIAFLIERFGAMHLQIYSTSNHIIWHYLNGISGTILLLSSFLLYPTLGINAFPVGMIIGYLACYSWYAPFKSYQLMNTQFIKYEYSGFLPSLLVLLILLINQIS
ncbi:lipopolysaccharide biosynthesis protein [Flectobacillus longus]|uniref:lipopolysaccharide biosynthesis protein n=1 Tax=Flectobacillus longus TaxID=2984207 RepID=UPI0024B69CC3|nr:hypothetical protein [Flectobacillus longus]MDI9880064.1 hypothetical protein [Flectobacillus longus]